MDVYSNRVLSSISIRVGKIPESRRYTLAACMSLEVLRGKIMPFHPAAHKQKPDPGQIRIADCVYSTLADSAMIVQDQEVEQWLRKMAGDEPRGLDEQIEDAYSIRAMPQDLWGRLETLSLWPRAVRRWP